MLATDGTATYVMFLYGDIQWGADRTTIGFNAGDGLHFFSLPEASNVFGLVTSTNVGIPGTFIFRVDQNQTLTMIGILYRLYYDCAALLSSSLFEL